MIRIGLVGVGFMGWIHWLAARKLKNAKVVAICSRDAKKRAGSSARTRSSLRVDQISTRTSTIVRSISSIRKGRPSSAFWRDAAK